MLVATLLSAAACRNTENDSSGNHELAQDLEGQETTMFHDDTTGGRMNTGKEAGMGDADRMSDPDFARNVAESSMMEVQLGQLAQQNASSQEVRQFGQMMVKAHTALNQELKQLTQGNGIDMPGSLSQQGMNKYTEMSRLKGVEFDRTYATMMVESHQKTMQMLMDYSEKTGPGTVDGSPSVTGTPQGGNTAAGGGGNTSSAGRNTTSGSGAASAANAGGTDAKNRNSTMAANDLRSWAVKNIPTIQMHLEHAQRLQKSVTSNVTRKGDELTSERQGAQGAQGKRQ